MNSTNSSGNSFTTPQSSPETTEANLRSIEHALDSFKNHLQDTVDTFNEHFQIFSSQDDDVLQRLNQTTAALNEQVSDHSTHTQHIETSL